MVTYGYWSLICEAVGGLLCKLVNMPMLTLPDKGHAAANQNKQN